MSLILPIYLYLLTRHVLCIFSSFFSLGIEDINKSKNTFVHQKDKRILQRKKKSGSGFNSIAQGRFALSGVGVPFQTSVSAENELRFIALYRKIFLSVLCLPLLGKVLCLLCSLGAFHEFWLKKKAGGNFINEGFKLSAVKSRQTAHEKKKKQDVPSVYPSFLSSLMAMIQSISLWGHRSYIWAHHSH